ncbi:MAG: VCBS repeat-containing protein [Planctomycetes bacterium]|nr:VCBS repeat-containing protein [Planctomycetota bacterium]
MGPSRPRAILATFCLVTSFATAQSPLFRTRHVLVEDITTSMLVRALYGVDLDRDGDEDFLVLQDQSPVIHAFINDGEERFAEDVTRFPTLPAGLDLAIGDVDGDSSPDVILIGPTLLLLNDGNGRFHQVQRLAPPTERTIRGLLADVTGDGWCDLFVVTSSEMYLYQGGGGTFTNISGRSLPAATYNQGYLALDIDGDTDLDIVGSSNVLENDGQGTFTANASLLPAGLAFANARAADYDADGDPDLLVWDNIPAELRLLRNQGGVFILDPTALGTLVQDVRNVASGDLDGDGDLDLMVLRGGNAALRWSFLENSSARFTAFAFNILGVPLFGDTFQLSDVDSDGDLDILAPGYEIFLALNDGSALFQYVTSRSTEWFLRQSPVIANVDADPFPELILDWGLGILNSDGYGDFVQSGSMLGNGLDLGKDVGDFDGDGDLDLARAMGGTPFPNGAPNEIWLNDGNGGFTPSPFPQPTTAEEETFVRCGDYDGDGDVDIFFSSDSVLSKIDRFWINQGNGQFQEVTPFPATQTDQTTSMDHGDFDGDGDLDLYVGRNHEDFVIWNQGGSFAIDRSIVPQIDSRTSTVKVGDLDGDGDVDCVTTTRYPSPYDEIHLLENVGGVFVERSTTLPLDARFASAEQLVDLDGDGDLDILLNHVAYRLGLASNIDVLWNEGQWNFALRPGTRVPRVAWSLAAADFDLDGDVDIYAACDWDCVGRVLWNTDRFLSSRWLPRVGRNFALDLSGPASAGWFLFASAGPATIPVPGLGLLQIDPSTASAVSAGVLNLEGDATFATVVPNAPSLVGHTMYWQAVTSHLTLTNGEATTFTSF